MALSDRTSRVLEVGIADKQAAEELVTAIDNASAGVVPAGSISNAELAADVKVGSLASLTTTVKTSVVGAVNELDAGKPDVVSPSVVGNLVSFADVTGGQADSGVAAADVVTTATELNTFTGTGPDTFATGAITTPGSNAASNVAPIESLVDVDAVVPPTLALVYDADPVVNLAAAELYAVVDISSRARNIRLESTQDSAASTAFTSANDGAFYSSTTIRGTGWVKHVAASTGVALFVDEADGYKIKADFTGAGNPGDAYFTLWLGACFWVDVKVYDAVTAGMKPLFYDDNGADNAKLIFVATDTANHNTSSAIGNLQLAAFADGGEMGVAAAQAFTDPVLTTTSYTPAGTLSHT